ncbi:MAG: SUMF1/EgtB/PvdO family nonheme iron enzyme [Gammaproteobacteria bacterium]|nr:SUMF1/EgtB/PvdO family nonheme iron enzyme [Gammaproteobacteria bacterium]
MSQPPVFISYPRDGANGQALARELRQRLRTESIDAFFDEESILPGDRWIHVLKAGAQQCKVMLSVVSSASHDRLWVEREYIAAVQEKVPVIPVLATEGDLPFQMNDLQAAKLYGNHKESEWLRVLAQIHKYLPDNAADEVRKAEITYLETLLRDNEERALRFAGKVYAPLAGQFRKEHKRVAAACMSPRLRHRKRTEYCEPAEMSGEGIEHGDVIAAFNEHKRLVLLGEPGAGKTFSLWRIAADYALQAQEQPGQMLPVVIPLNRWDAPGLELHDFVLQQLGDLSGHFDCLYEGKRLLPLFDAINEIPFDQREEKLPQVRRWLGRYPTDRVLLTCRLRDYRGPLEQELDRLTIEPLDPPRIHDFLHNYFAEDAAAHRMAENLFWQLAGGEAMHSIWQDWIKRGHEQHWEEFWTLAAIPKEWQTGDNEHWWEGNRRQQYLNDPRSLMKLAANPYLLTQMVVIYSEQQQLPQSRIELFSEFVEDLIYREVQAKPENHYPKAHQVDLQAELKQLAWQLQSRSGSLEEARTTLPRTEAEQTMPLVRLEFAAAASLLELSRDSVRFSHQLLQEFFTAQSFGERREEGLKASDLWPADRWWEPNGWEEAAKLAAEYEADPKPFLQWLAAGNPKLAAEIAREQGLLDQHLFAEFREQWQSAITDIEQYSHPYERHAISTVLAWLGWDNRPYIGLDAKGLPDIDWLEIPAGEFTYQTDQRLDLPAYKMSRYPVTNAQFRAFVLAEDGYNNDRWWSGLKKPDTPHESRWKESNRPVEQVDWYEAMAFCEWLKDKVHLDIRLPTEQQWEKAAQGVSGQEYPWGNGYKTGYANIDETARFFGEKVGAYFLGETSAVGLYPQDQSPCGLMDMSGNVGEWCLNKWDDPLTITADLSDSSRVVRGSSWNGDSGSCRSSSRGGGLPLSGNFCQGFRVVLCLFPHSSQ